MKEEDASEASVQMNAGKARRAESNLALACTFVEPRRGDIMLCVYKTLSFKT